MDITIDQIVLIATTVTGIFTTLFYSRKARRAEVHAREIDNADKMIDLVKKANEEATSVQTRMLDAIREEYERVSKACREQKEWNRELKNENKRFKLIAERLEKALKSIPLCPYSEKCPVKEELKQDKPQTVK